MLTFQILVIASIHQPSTTTFELFDKLFLLSRGKVAYNGSIAGVKTYFANLGFNMPLYMNPAEYIIQLVNTDFSRDAVKSAEQLKRLQTAWTQYESTNPPLQNTEIPNTPPVVDADLADQGSANPLLIPFTLIHRSFIKSYRDVVAYGIRIAMYIGLAIMMGTVWPQINPTSTPSPTRSSSAERSCLSWLLHTSPPSSKTAPSSSRKDIMACMDLRLS
jgi:hypothetical protein